MRHRRRPGEGEIGWIPGRQRSRVGRQEPAGRAAHGLAYEDRLKYLSHRGANDCHHGQQAEQQHTGRRQQHGQELRELNSEENHESFPSLTATCESRVNASVAGRENCV